MAIRKPTKKAVKSRDTAKCRKCGSDRDIQLHHVLPQRLGGPDADFNLVCLCQTCHALWHKIEFDMGIGYAKKRVVEYFYSWLKEDKNVDIFLSNCKVWRDFKAASKALKTQKTEKPKKAKQ